MEGRWLGAVSLLAAGLAAAGCGYSFSPHGGSAHKSIAIPMFVNETLEYGLEERITRSLTEAFLDDNRIEVVAAEEAETILRGRVTGYERKAYSFDEREQVQEYRIEVTLDLEYQEVSSGNTIWHEEHFFVWASYDPFADPPEDEETGKDRVVDKLSREVVARTLEGW